jgi:hypothetical protein
MNVMNLTTIILTLTLFVLPSASSKSQKQECASPEPSGWEREGLKGRVKTIRIEEVQHTYGNHERELKKQITFDARGNYVETREPMMLPEVFKHNEPKPVYTFNADCKPIERRGLVGEWEMTKTTYLYNEKGKLKEQSVYDLEGRLLWKAVYSFDDRGNVNEETETIQVHPEHFRPPRYDVYRTTRSTFKHDERGNVIEELSYKYDGSLYAKYVNVYDTTNRVTKFQRFDKDGKLEEEKTFTYDSSGNLVSERRYSDFGYIWDALMTYKYDAHGNWIEEVESTRNKEKGESDYKLYSTTYRIIKYH